MEDRMATTKKPSFDVSNYIIDTAPSTEIVRIPETGDEFEVQVKQISWATRNQLITKHMKWDGEGNTSFNADQYVREALTLMIVDAPWGKTTESFLISVDSRLGGALEQLVPQAFGMDEISSDPQAIKKE